MRVKLPSLVLSAGILMLTKPSLAATVSTFDVLMATGTLIVSGTTTITGNAFSVGGSTFTINQGFVGVGTATPVALLNLAGPVINGNGAQFQWIAKYAALRSGEIQGTHWDSTGTYSVAFGFNGKASGNGSVVSGGHYNSATDQNATVAGGYTNTASGQHSTVAGGDTNAASATRSFVGGGYNNLASGPSAAVLGGGQTVAGAAARNTASGTSAAVLGGISNTASGDYSAILGGSNNEASGKYSLASGQMARALAQGSFVWGDSQSGIFVSNNTDEFKIRAQGGFVFVSTPTSSAPTILVSSGAIMISTSASAATAVPNLFISSVNGNVGIGNISPATPLDVNGSAQFGSSASKSTFTATPGGSTYALQLSSGITISGGGPINLTSGGFVRFADGSISTTAVSGGGGSAVVQSTTVYMDTGQALGTGIWPACFTNSTATLTGVTSSCVLVLASGSWLLDSAGYNYGLALIVNGELVAGTDNSKRSHGQVWEQPSGGGYVWPFTIAERVCGLSSSTVNVCLTGSAENSATLAGTSGSHTARKPTLSIIEVRQ